MGFLWNVFLGDPKSGIFMGFSWDCGIFMGLLWEFEDLMSFFFGICKGFPGIYWEISGIYSLTRFFLWE